MPAHTTSRASLDVIDEHTLDLLARLAPVLAIAATDVTAMINARRALKTTTTGGTPAVWLVPNRHASDTAATTARHLRDLVDAATLAAEWCDHMAHVRQLDYEDAARAAAEPHALEAALNRGLS